MHSRALELVGALWTLGLFQPAVPRSPQESPLASESTEKHLSIAFQEKALFSYF